MDNQPIPRITIPTVTIDESVKDSPSTPPLLSGNRKKIIIVGAIVAAAAIIATVLWLYMRKDGNGTEPNVKIYFDALPNIVSGSATRFSLVYENRENSDINNLQLEVLYPNGFRFISSQPDSQDGAGRNFRLDKLAVGQTAKVELYGIFTGSPQENKPLQAKLYFKLQNASSTFSTRTESQISLLAPDFNLRLSAPSQVVNSQVVDYIISFQNISDQDLERAVIRLTYPDGFKFLNAGNDPTRGDNEWELGTLAVGEQGELKIHGTLLGSVHDEKIIQADLGYFGAENEFVLQSRSSATSVIAESPLQAKITSSPLSGLVKEGEEDTYTVAYENVGLMPIQNAKITVKIESGVIDFSSIGAIGGALVGNDLVWNSSVVPQLVLLQPGQKGELSFGMRVKNNLRQLGVKSPTIKLTVAVSSLELPQPITLQTLELKVKTEILATAKVDYISGPNPPQSGQETIYRVSFNLSTTVNDISDVVWQGFVSTPIVSVVDGTVAGASAGELNFTANTGKLAWRIANLSAFGSANVIFQIKVLPSTIVDNNLVLIRDLEVSARDDFTEQTSTATVNPQLRAP